MATFWVDSEGTGSDANDGSTLALAKRTIGAGLGLITGTVGNTLNLVARATFYPVTVTTVVTNCIGTSYSSFGCKIQGTNASGNTGPLAVISWEDSATAHTAIRFEGTSAFCIVQGFDLDRRGNTIASSTKRFVEINSTSVNNIRIRVCVDHPQDSPVIVSGQILNVLTANTNNIGDVSYCYFVNPRTNAGISILSTASVTFEYHHNIQEHNLSQPGFQITNAGFGSTTNISMHHNTMVVRPTGRGLFFFGSHTTANAAAVMSCHSNVLAELAVVTVNSSFMLGNAAWENLAWTGTRDIGWNLFTTTDTVFNWSVIHPYQVPWDVNNLDVPDDTGQAWTTDTVATLVDPFNNSGIAWIWENVNGTGYNITLSGDFRLKLYRTVDKTSSVPGAIVDGIISSDQIQFRLSGGASNANPDASLGGVISTHDVVPEEIINNLFDNVSSAEASAGDTEYRCYYVINVSTSSWFASEVWIQTDTGSANTTVDIGLDPAGVNGTATTIANESTVPTGVTFTHPTASPGLSIGTIPAGQYQAVWIKRIVTAGAASSPIDTTILRHSGSDV